MAKQTPENTVVNSVPPRMRDRYTLRVVTAEFKPSSKGNPQITLNCEIINPLKKKFDGKEFALDGLDVRYYLPCKGDRVGQTFEFKRKMGLPVEVDDENEDPKPYQSLVFDAVLDSREKQHTRPDPNNPGQYLPILDGEGKPIKGGWEIVANVDDVLYKTVVKTNKPY